MGKKPKADAQHVRAHATAARYDGGAVKIEIVFQPEAAAKLVDQMIVSLIGNGRKQ